MAKHTVLINDETVTGTPLELVKIMQKQHWFANDDTTYEYIDRTKHTIWRLFGIGISIPEKHSLEDKCSILLNQLIDNRLLVEVS